MAGNLSHYVRFNQHGSSLKLSQLKSLEADFLRLSDKSVLSKASFLRYLEKDCISDFIVDAIYATFMQVNRGGLTLREFLGVCELFSKGCAADRFSFFYAVSRFGSKLIGTSVRENIDGNLYKSLFEMVENDVILQRVELEHSSSLSMGQLSHSRSNPLPVIHHDVSHLTIIEEEENSSDEDDIQLEEQMVTENDVKLDEVAVDLNSLEVNTSESNQREKILVKQSEHSNLKKSKSMPYIQREMKSDMFLSKQSIAISEDNGLVNFILAHNAKYLSSNSSFSLFSPVHLVSDYICFRYLHNITFEQFMCCNNETSRLDCLDNVNIDSKFYHRLGEHVMQWWIQHANVMEYFIGIQRSKMCTFIDALFSLFAVTKNSEPNFIGDCFANLESYFNFIPYEFVEYCSRVYFQALKQGHPELSVGHIMLLVGSLFNKTDINLVFSDRLSSGLARLSEVCSLLTRDRKVCGIEKNVKSANSFYNLSSNVQGFVLLLYSLRRDYIFTNTVTNIDYSDLVSIRLWCFLWFLPTNLDGSTNISKHEMHRFLDEIIDEFDIKAPIIISLEPYCKLVPTVPVTYAAGKFEHFLIDSLFFDIHTDVYLRLAYPLFFLNNLDKSHSTASAMQLLCGLRHLQCRLANISKMPSFLYENGSFESSSSSLDTRVNTHDFSTSQLVFAIFIFLMPLYIIGLPAQISFELISTDLELTRVGSLGCVYCFGWMVTSLTSSIVNIDLLNFYIFFQVFRIIGFVILLFSGYYLTNNLFVIGFFLAGLGNCSFVFLFYSNKLHNFDFMKSFSHHSALLSTGSMVLVISFLVQSVASFLNPILFDRFGMLSLYYFLIVLTVLEFVISLFFYNSTFVPGVDIASSLSSSGWSIFVNSISSKVKFSQPNQLLNFRPFSVLFRIPVSSIMYLIFEFVSFAAIISPLWFLPQYINITRGSTLLLSSFFTIGVINLVASMLLPVYCYILKTYGWQLSLTCFCLCLQGVGIVILRETTLHSVVVSLFYSPSFALILYNSCTTFNKNFLEGDSRLLLFMLRLLGIIFGSSISSALYTPSNYSMWIFILCLIGVSILSLLVIIYLNRINHGDLEFKHKRFKLHLSDVPYYNTNRYC